MVHTLFIKPLFSRPKNIHRILANLNILPTKIGQDRSFKICDAKFHEKITT